MRSVTIAFRSPSRFFRARTCPMPPAAPATTALTIVMCLFGSWRCMSSRSGGVEESKLKDGERRRKKIWWLEVHHAPVLLVLTWEGGGRQGTGPAGYREDV
jgi:hypothetical protein